MEFRFLFRTVCFEIIMSIWFIPTSKNEKCEGIRNNGCCDGYFWNNETENCTQCMTGHTGPNCTIPCPYPTFGNLCQGYCNCSNDTCDVYTGCTTQTTDEETCFSVTIESTSSDAKTKLCRREVSVSNTSSTANSFLIILIKIFGSVDLLLICTYLVIFAIDRKRNKGAIPKENTEEHNRRNNLLYDDIEIVILPTD